MNAVFHLSVAFLSHFAVRWSMSVNHNTDAIQRNLCTVLYLPKAKLATDNSGGIVVEHIVTDGTPDSFVIDLQTTFTLCSTADKPRNYNSHCTLLTTCFKLIVANAKPMSYLCKSS